MKIIIDETAGSCHSKLEEVCTRYDGIIVELRGKLRAAEAMLLDARRCGQEENQGQELEEQELELQEQEQELGHDLQPTPQPRPISPPLSPATADVGDFVKLEQLNTAELNGESGTVTAFLDNGRYCVELLGHKSRRKVCIKPENVCILASRRRVEELTGGHRLNTSPRA